MTFIVARRWRRPRRGCSTLYRSIRNNDDADDKRKDLKTRVLISNNVRWKKWQKPTYFSSILLKGWITKTALTLYTKGHILGIYSPLSPMCRYKLLQFYTKALKCVNKAKRQKRCYKTLGVSGMEDIFQLSSPPVWLCLVSGRRSSALILVEMFDSCWWRKWRCLPADLTSPGGLITDFCLSHGGVLTQDQDEGFFLLYNQTRRALELTVSALVQIKCSRKQLGL